jgi:hypothetical protein
MKRPIRDLRSRSEQQSEDHFYSRWWNFRDALQDEDVLQLFSQLLQHANSYTQAEVAQTIAGYLESEGRSFREKVLVDERQVRAGVDLSDEILHAYSAKPKAVLYRTLRLVLDVPLRLESAYPCLLAFLEWLTTRTGAVLSKGCIAASDLIARSTDGRERFELLGWLNPFVEVLPPEDTDRLLFVLDRDLEPARARGAYLAEDTVYSDVFKIAATAYEIGVNGDSERALTLFSDALEKVDLLDGQNGPATLWLHSEIGAVCAATSRLVAAIDHYSKFLRISFGAKPLASTAVTTLATSWAAIKLGNLLIRANRHSAAKEVYAGARVLLSRYAPSTPGDLLFAKIDEFNPSEARSSDSVLTSESNSIIDEACLRALECLSASKTEELIDKNKTPSGASGPLIRTRAERLKFFSGRTRWVDAVSSDPSLKPLDHIDRVYPDRRRGLLRPDLWTIDPSLAQALKNWLNYKRSDGSKPNSIPMSFGLLTKAEWYELVEREEGTLSGADVFKALRAGDSNAAELSRRFSALEKRRKAAPARPKRKARGVPPDTNP